MLLFLIKKELLIELRSKQVILSMLVFGLSILLVFVFSTNVSRVIIANYAPGMFWLLILFVTVLGVHRSFSYEKEFDAFSMLVSAPIDRGLIYLSKCISGFIFLSLMEVLIFFPFFKFLMIDFPINIKFFISTTLLINLAIMTVSNLVSGITMRTNLSEILLPILLFPLLSPIIIAATKILTGIMNNEPYSLWLIWIYIVTSVVVVFGLAGYALFDYIIEE